MPAVTARVCETNSDQKIIFVFVLVLVLWASVEVYVWQIVQNSLWLFEIIKSLADGF